MRTCPLVLLKALVWAAADPAAAEPAGVFEAYLTTETPPADGFDFPVGDPDGQGAYVDPRTRRRHRGWYVATRFAERFGLGIHPGEDWNGRGGGNTDLGQPVHAIAAGRVVHATDHAGLWGKVVIVQHVYYENHEKKRIRSLYAHLAEIRVAAGDEVARRQVLGTIGQDAGRKYLAHLHLELRLDESLAPTYWPSSHARTADWVRERYAAPTAFIASHRELFVPAREPLLVLVDQESYAMRIYERGQPRGQYSVAFGQAQGAKRVRGDNRTPKGMYFVTERSRGPFGGEFGAYFGGHWIKLNYPNGFDAERGLRDGLLTRAQAAEIRSDWLARRPTRGDTRLGGGIGFHGWATEWDDAGPRHLSWGCVVLHNRDIAAFYDRIPVGTMVVIF
jgi:murein DD-endopeptidase MepM/ murein hydrolase activator NlpD